MGEDSGEVVDLNAYRDDKELDERDPAMDSALSALYGPSTHPWEMYAAEKRFMACLKQAIEEESAGGESPATTD